ncbi:phage tail protein I, partial [Methylobacterium gnaphalii]
MADADRNTLLPSHATPRERSIGGANAAVTDADTDLIRRAGSPDIEEVPAAYLPARAEAVSVDVWDPLWPDDIKRATIKAAPEVHRHKGTVYAVKTALSALKIDAEVIEWWQEAPRGVPYAFTVKARARARLYDGPLLDPRLIKVAYTSVLRAKPLSRAFDIVIGAGFGDTLGLA